MYYISETFFLEWIFPLRCPGGDTLLMFPWVTCTSLSLDQSKAWTRAKGDIIIFVLCTVCQYIGRNGCDQNDDERERNSRLHPVSIV